MPYKFTFDLSGIQHHFFAEVTRISYQRGLHRKIGRITLEILKRSKIQETTGLNLSDAVLLLQDFVEMQARNLLEKKEFVQTRKRVLLLPHCSRKYMDNQCEAVFDSNTPSYFCEHCSSDCLVNRAVSFAEKKGYDVYVLPGGSCVEKILKAKHYEGAVGVACGEEIKLSRPMLKSMGVAGQAVPLIKNGCANTIFNIETLFKTL